MSFDAVLFDCDGVLVDSEAITCGTLRDLLEQDGWRMTLEECIEVFLGRTVRDLAGRIEANTGKPLTDAWMAAFYAERNLRLEREITAMPGVQAAVAQVHARCEGRIAVASGADRYKIEMMLDKVGLLHFFQGRIFSGHEVGKNKPAPDVYLAAAAGLGVAPTRCLVVEDTAIGATAGVAAGATVWGYSPNSQYLSALRQVGVGRVFTHMDALRLPA